MTFFLSELISLLVMHSTITAAIKHAEMSVKNDASGGYKQTSILMLTCLNQHKITVAGWLKLSCGWQSSQTSSPLLRD